MDWAQLVRLFSGRVYDQHGAIIDGRKRQPSSANLEGATDRANWKGTVATGAPVWLGKGCGNATAKPHRVCVLGARMTLDPTLTLAEIDGQLRDIHDLVQDMASAAG